MTHQAAVFNPARFMMNTAALAAPRAMPQASPADAGPVTHQADVYGIPAAAPLPGDGLRAYAQSVRGISLDQAADLQYL